MEIRTERLTVRFANPGDWKAIQSIRESFNASLYAGFDTPMDLSDPASKVRARRWAEATAAGTDHMFFMICLDGEVIGYMSCNIREGSHEIGYCFASKHQGKGYAKESFTYIFKYLKTLGISRLTAGTALENLPSAGLLKSLGFELTGTEWLSFYKDESGRDIFFEGGNFELDLNNF